MMFMIGNIGTAEAMNNGLAKKPPMAWSNWNIAGCTGELTYEYIVSHLDAEQETYLVSMLRNDTIAGARRSILKIRPRLNLSSVAA